MLEARCFLAFPRDRGSKIAAHVPINQRVLLAMIRFVFTALLALLQLNVAAATEPAPEQVRLQVLFRQEPMMVHHRSSFENLEGFAGFAAALRAARMGKELTKLTSDFKRSKAVAESFERSLSSRYPVFNVSVEHEGPHPGRDADLPRLAKAAGFNYVLLLDEYTNYSSADIPYKKGEVVISAVLRCTLYDAATNKVLTRVYVEARSAKQQLLTSAMATVDFFQSNYPEVSDTLVAALTDSLLEEDKLHEMAASIGKGAEVPAVGMIKARYEDAVSIKLKAPAHWVNLKSHTPYRMISTPSSSYSYRLAVWVEADLLLGELGQNVTTVEDYLAIVRERYKEVGFDLSTLAPYQGGGLLALPGYTAFSVKMQNPDGGGRLLFFKVLEKPFIAVKTVVVIDKDMDGTIAANRASIEAALLSANVKITASKLPQ